MRFNAKVKEKIARIIAENFTTNEITNVFANLNIKTDETLYAKWKITLDAFNKLSTEEEFFKIIEQFCHPLNFEDSEIVNVRPIFIENLNRILDYENVEIFSSEKNVTIVSEGKFQYDFSKMKPLIKTSTDYVVDALNFFKNEYNKTRMSGLSYEYSLGENPQSEQLQLGDEEEYSFKLESIKQLKDIGFISEYKIEERTEGSGYYIWDYAICKVDENQITEKKKPEATNAGVESITQKIIHEHIQKIEITSMPELKVKNIEENVIVKNNKKRITLPKFSRTDWAKISIRFIDERNIILSNEKETKPTSFESLGCDDGRNGKPDENWNFLLRLAVGNGQTPPILKLEREKQKKQKQKITDILKKIFKNDTDPFETQSGGVYKAKFIIAYPTNTDNKITKNKYDDLYEFHSEITES